MRHTHTRAPTVRFMPPLDVSIAGIDEAADLAGTSSGEALQDRGA